MLKGKIMVAGSTGMVGSAVVRELENLTDCTILPVSRKTCDLTDMAKTKDLLYDLRPDYIFLCAAHVGGLPANIARPADFTYFNLAIQTNVIHLAANIGVKKLLFVGSSCMYPRDCPQPMRPQHLFSSPLEPTNRSYVVAKFAGLAMCQAYRQQFGFNAITLIPPNLYGPGDYYSERAHVIAALIDKFHKCKVNGDPQVGVFGDGSARREFLYVEDFAKAAVFAMEHYNSGEPINVGSDEDISILDLASLIAATVGLPRERIRWDRTGPTGIQQKLMDSSAFRGWWPHKLTSLKDGLAKAYQDYLKTGGGRR